MITMARLLGLHRYEWTTLLLTKLRERIEKVTGEEKGTFNIELGKSSRNQKSKVGIDKTINNLTQLNENQFRSIQVSNESDVLYLWGPPGTGKTFTLAQVIDFFYKRKNVSCWYQIRI